MDIFRLSNDELEGVGSKIVPMRGKWVCVGRIVGEGLHKDHQTVGSYERHPPKVSPFLAQN